MRDPNRIDPILARLRAAWIARPDLRLGQLIAGSLPMRPIYGYPSDDAWMADRLRRLFAAECSEFGAANAPIVWPAVDRPAPTPAADPLATVLAALDAMSTHATGPWPAEIVVQVLNAAPAIAELCAEVERLRAERDSARDSMATAHVTAAKVGDDLIATRAKLAEAKRLGLEACALPPFSRETNERAGAIAAALEAL
ncbi:MAG: hypothetical protein KBD62_38015 [Kofleriaceae bacterium]|nr:hypothetical protein [Kofleriaceae bacterium]